MALEVDAIHTYYGESHVLHGISLRVDPGELAEVRWAALDDPPQPLGRDAAALLELLGGAR